jgi:hypothetical protein
MSSSSAISGPKIPTLVVYKTSNNEELDLKNRDTSYHLILTPPPSRLWLSPSTTTVAIHGPEPPKNLHAGSIERAIIHHPWLAAYACTIGSIHPSRGPKTIANVPRAPRGGPFTDIFSGLGHGKWYDYKLTKLLGLDACVEPLSRNDKPLKWVAGAGKWDPIEWEGRGTVIGGHLKLKRDNDEEVLAVYKARGATLRQKVESDVLEEEWEDCSETGTGSLGILREDGITEEVVRHMLLTCVGIEEQILRSKGFGGTYHGSWM